MNLKTFTQILVGILLCIISQMYIYILYKIQLNIIISYIIILPTSWFIGWNIGKFVYWNYNNLEK